jgi:hypothetical protein
MKPIIFNIEPYFNIAVKLKSNYGKIKNTKHSLDERIKLHHKQIRLLKKLKSLSEV